MIDDQAKTNYSETELLKMAIKTAGIAYWQWNPKTNELKFDQDWFKKMEVTDESSLDSWMSSLHPDDSEMVSQKIKDHLEGKSDFYEALMRLKSKSGDYKYVLAKGKIVERDEDGVPTNFSGVHVDLTEMMLLKKENEDNKTKMIQSSKLASLGEMAGGIAHEISTPLSVIHGYAEMLEENNVDNKFNSKIAKKIVETSMKIAETISALRNLAKKDNKEQSKNFNVEESVGDSLMLMIGLLRQESILLENESKNFPVFGSKVEITQVLVNLIQNSIDELRTQSLDNRWIKIKFSEDKGFNYLSVSDSGKGVSSEIKDKIMQPFFTTKPVGSGSGLGLSLSHEILRNHKGEIYLDDKEKNTTFVIKLPKV